MAPHHWLFMPNGRKRQNRAHNHPAGLCVWAVESCSHKPHIKIRRRIAPSLLFV
jgi:hypothetical protein